MRLGVLRATATLVATIASFCIVYALCEYFGTDAQPAMVAAVLALTLTRRAVPANGAQILIAPLTLTGVALAATGIGHLLLTIPPLGAAVFVLGMFLSVWLRNFGERARTAGTLIALPLVAILIVPGAVGPPRGGALAHLLLVICAGFVAHFSAVLVQWTARRAGVPLFEAEAKPAGSADAQKRPGITVQTRMALQMAVALGAAFVLGFRFFPGHWAWAVLTAFIVCSGARGRGDAAYKGVLRLIGAIGGTLVAAAVVHVWTPSGVLEAVAIFVALFVGLSLRDINYAYWAACMTLVLAMLASQGKLEMGFLALRLEAILAGALGAVAATWFVFPIRTESIVRRYLADALRAFDDLLVHGPESDAERTARLTHFEHRMAELERVAPPVRWHRRLFVYRPAPEHPAQWIDLTNGLKLHLVARDQRFVANRKRAAAVRRAIGISRRAIANHGKNDATPGALSISASLRSLSETLAEPKEEPR
jgi:hypothetical protein